MDSVLGTVDCSCRLSGHGLHPTAVHVRIGFGHAYFNDFRMELALCSRDDDLARPCSKYRQLGALGS